MLGGAISIPRLQTELRTEASLHHSPDRVSLQMESSAAAYGNSVSEKVVFTYGMGIYHDVEILPILHITHVYISYPEHLHTQ